MIGILVIAVIYSGANFMWLNARHRLKDAQADTWAVIADSVAFGLLLWVAVKVLT